MESRSFCLQEFTSFVDMNYHKDSKKSSKEEMIYYKNLAPQNHQQIHATATS
jgi:hypothetical protein